MSDVLMVITGADRLILADGRDHPTGFWAEEVVELHRGLTAAGHAVTFATPGGRSAPVDPASLDSASDHGRELRTYLDTIAAQLQHPRSLSEVTVSGYAALALPGGHGPMADLATDAALGRILRDMTGRGGIVATLCHGAAGLLSAVDPDGRLPIAGRRIAAFTDDEELLGGLGANTPYLLASRLAEAGAVLQTGAPWSSTVVTDGGLISGQNPQSSVALTSALVDALTHDR